MSEPEVAIAKLEERLASQSQSLTDLRAENRIAHSEVMSLVKHLDARITELTDVVRQLKQDQTTNDMRWFQHKEWADARGVELETLIRQHHENNIRSGVWKSQFAWLFSGGGVATAAFAVLRFLKVI